MSYSDLIARRRSIRGYRPEPVEEDQLQQVLDAGRLAPSACNIQPWYFVVVKGDEVKNLAQAYGRDWFSTAPVAIVVCVDRETCWKRADGKDYGDVDAAIAMDHMILAATELGLGTCWVGAFDAEIARKVLNVPDHIDPVLMTPLGYPAKSPDARPRKALEEIVRWGGF